MQERVTEAASKLLKSGDYLWLPDSSEVCDNYVGLRLVILIFRASIGTLYHRFLMTRAEISTTATVRKC